MRWDPQTVFNTNYFIILLVPLITKNYEMVNRPSGFSAETNLKVLSIVHICWKLLLDMQIRDLTPTLKDALCVHPLKSHACTVQYQNITVQYQCRWSCKCFSHDNNIWFANEVYRLNKALIHWTTFSKALQRKVMYKFKA